MRWSFRLGACRDTTTCETALPQRGDTYRTAELLSRAPCSNNRFFLRCIDEGYLKQELLADLIDNRASFHTHPWLFRVFFITTIISVRYVPMSNSVEPCWNQYLFVEIRAVRMFSCIAAHNRDATKMSEARACGIQTSRMARGTAPLSLTSLESWPPSDIGSKQVVYL